MLPFYCLTRHIYIAAALFIVISYRVLLTPIFCVLDDDLDMPTIFRTALYLHL